jgi:hypothetical protein
MKKHRVQMRFPNSFGWETVKIDLAECNAVAIFDDEVFVSVKNQVVSIKKETLPKSFVNQKKG